MLDTLIDNAVVFDGEAIESRRVSVGVIGERIAYVGSELTGAAAHTVVDGRGLYLCPGFIDTHASTGLGYRFPNAGDNKLFQGVTTEVIGNCGTSTAPIGEALVPTMENLAAEIGFEFDWRTLSEWFVGVEAYGLPFNVGTFVGHSTLRGGIRDDAHEISHEELQGMVAAAEQAMEEGALGLSTGLVYAPGSFADTAELITLSAAVARLGGIYVSHLRDERESLLDAIEETFEIARHTGIAILISHLKSAERPNWGGIPTAIERIEAARREGLSVTYDVYPYAAASTKLRTFIPKATMKGGVRGMLERLRSEEWRMRAARWLIERGTDFGGMMLLTESSYGAVGKSIAQVAAAHGREPSHMVVDILQNDPDTWIIYHCIAEHDMDAAILWEASIICSDSWSYPVNAPRQIGHPHPRTFGAFTRFLERYCLRQERIPFGQAIRKITSYPADWLQIRDRGRIAEGNFADLVMLDPEAVRERATYSDPRQLSEGTEHVWVNGTPMIQRGELQPGGPGRFVRGHPTGDRRICDE